MLLFIVEYLFIEFFDFLFEIINFSSDHGEFLLDSIQKLIWDHVSVFVVLFFEDFYLIENLLSL